MNRAWRIGPAALALSVALSLAALPACRGGGGGTAGDAAGVECDSGPCCGASGLYLPDSQVCADNVATQYQCSNGGQACGGDAQARTQVQYCSGYSADCDGRNGWGDWATTQSCDARSGFCQTDGTTFASCADCSPDVCQPGPACQCPDAESSSPDSPVDLGSYTDCGTGPVGRNADTGPGDKDYFSVHVEDDPICVIQPSVKVDLYDGVINLFAWWTCDSGTGASLVCKNGTSWLCTSSGACPDCAVVPCCIANGSGSSNEVDLSPTCSGGLNDTGTMEVLVKAVGVPACGSYRLQLVDF